MCFNYKGEIIEGHKHLRKEEYGTGKEDEYGEPEVNWDLLKPRADGEGFDKDRLIDGKKYRVYKITLAKGQKIIRYGHACGRFTAPEGTEFEELSLPYTKESCEYHEYVVVGDSLDAACIVDKGFVSPGFDMPGGGIQYWHYRSINISIKAGILEEDLQWINQSSKN